MKINFLNESSGSGWETWLFVGLLVVLVIALLVVPMFTNKKRAKQTAELHSSLQPGDVIKTVGGVIGTIKEIRQISPVDKEMIVETGEGDNKVTMTFDIAALYQVLSRANAPAPAPTAAPAKEEPKAVEAPAEKAEPEIKAEEPVEPVAATEPVAAVEEAPAAEETAAVEAPAEAAEPEKKPTPPKKKPVNSKNSKK